MRQIIPPTIGTWVNKVGADRFRFVGVAMSLVSFIAAVKQMRQIVPPTIVLKGSL